MLRFLLLIIAFLPSCTFMKEAFELQTRARYLRPQNLNNYLPNTYVHPHPEFTSRTIYHPYINSPRIYFTRIYR